MKQLQKIYFTIFLVGSCVISQEAGWAMDGGSFLSLLDRCKSFCGSKGMSNCDGCGGANNPGVCKPIAGSKCSCCEKQALPSSNPVAIQPTAPVQISHPTVPTVQPVVKAPEAPIDTSTPPPTLPQGPYLEKCENCEINPRGIITCRSCQTAAGTALMVQLKPQGVTSLETIPLEKQKELAENGFALKNSLVTPFNPKNCGSPINVDAQGELTCNNFSAKDIERIFELDDVTTATQP